MQHRFKRKARDDAYRASISVAGESAANKNEIMVALWNRETIYIFILSFVLSSTSSSFFPRLISAAADWMSAILPHMVWPECEFKMQV